MLKIEGVPLEVDLIVLDMLGFDVILGMDWLFRHFPSIDCHLRTITFLVKRMEVWIHR